MNYERLAKQVVQLALKNGADQADVFLQVGRSADVRVRDGDIEDLSQATGKGLGLRVFVKKRLGFSYTSDLTPSSLREFVERAVDLAKVSAPNPLNGITSLKGFGRPQKVGPLFDPDIANLSPDWKIKCALEMEKVVKAYDARISAIDSVGAGESVSEVYLCTSEGFQHAYEGTSVYLYASPVAKEDGQLQTSSWVDYKRFLKTLESPESVATEAARRVIRMLGAKKMKSQRVPVVFDPRMAAGFIAGIASAANGDLVYKKSSFLAAKMQQKIAAKSVTIVDDGLLPGGLSTSPVDAEGVPTKTTDIVKDGVLNSFLYDGFTARKAKTKSTGNASRGYRSTPGISTHNLYLRPGNVTPETLIGGVKQGLYVTSMLGHGANVVTGDYSRGANGLWIENGELTHSVQEVTVGGNLLAMLQSIDAIGSDLTFRGSTGAPTVRFSELTVSGA
jgi:PmbA protein